MKSCLLSFLSKLTWLITALFALHAGLKQLGWFDLFANPAIAGNAQLVAILHYVVGAAGAFSLVVFILSSLYRGCCDEKQCK